MENDLIQQIAETQSEATQAAEESLRLGLLQAHIATETLDSNKGLLCDLAGIIASVWGNRCLVGDTSGIAGHDQGDGIRFGSGVGE